jgi:hypothetical protein
MEGNDLMKILFVIRHTGYLRHYESVIELLAQRGHDVHVGFNSLPNKAHLGKEQITKLCQQYPNVTTSEVPNRRDVWKVLLYYLRGMRDYLRYLHPRYNKATKLVQRARNHFGFLTSLFFRLIPGMRTASGQHWMQGVLRWIETTAPSSKHVDQHMLDQNPDVVLVTPLVDFGSRQLDYLKAAQNHGLHNALCVASWDNLTNKGVIQLEPESVIVWNHDQKQEAIELHDIPADKVTVTGAQSFDKWFERKPSTTRWEFCTRHGLDPARPIILYMCSSGFIAEEEAKYACKWLDALRNSLDSSVANANVLIRPHPLNAGQWADVDLSHYPNVTVFPRGGAYVTTDDAKADYFDTIYHSAAVVGINTSALIEAGIVGKTSHTILAPEFADTQEGTLHFEYLIRDGYLKVARDLDEHCRHLRETLDAGAEGQAHVKKFVGAFIRPHGLGRACTPIVADAIEELARRPALPKPAPTAGTYSARLCLLPVAISGYLCELAYRACRKVCVLTYQTVTGTKPPDRMLKKAARLPAGTPLQSVGQRQTQETAGQR